MTTEGSSKNMAKTSTYTEAEDRIILNHGTNYTGAIAALTAAGYKHRSVTQVQYRRYYLMDRQGPTTVEKAMSSHASLLRKRANLQKKHTATMRAMKATDRALVDSANQLQDLTLTLIGEERGQAFALVPDVA